MGKAAAAAPTGGHALHGRRAIRRDRVERRTSGSRGLYRTSVLISFIENHLERHRFGEVGARACTSKRQNPTPCASGPNESAFTENPCSASHLSPCTPPTPPLYLPVNIDVLLASVTGDRRRARRDGELVIRVRDHAHRYVAVVFAAIASLAGCMAGCAFALGVCRHQPCHRLPRDARARAQPCVRARGSCWVRGALRSASAGRADEKLLVGVVDGNSAAVWSL